MKPSERDAAYLWDMLDAARNARKLTRGFTLAGIMKDFRTRLALERSMEIVGEAARRVSEKFRGECGEIPWKGIIGLRNIIAHEYGELDHNRLYTVAREGVPELIRTLEKILGKNRRSR
ncbi:MAG TPA: HepT-like ribonuclease domain-containing protein [Burkholderiales bacterium]|jgi:uncharacterized protein with HEPN domain